MSTAPTRTRPTWPELPAGVRAAIEARLGAPVTAWASHDGGYSPGMASTLRTATGATFVKAVPAAHEFAARAYREEARRSAVLPAGAPAPPLHWQLEVDAGEPWVAVAFDPVAGRAPVTPLVGADLDAVLRLAAEVAEHRVAPGVLPDAVSSLPTGHAAALADRRPAGLGTYDPWLAAHLDRLAAIEQDVGAAVAGDRLVHGDLRGDNAVILDGGPGGGEPPRAVAVDWPYAGRGAAFCDLVGMLPAVHAEGGPPPHEVLARTALPGAPDDGAVTAFLATIAAYFVDSSLEPPPPGIPHVRAFQRAQAEVCIDWLRERLGP